MADLTKVVEALIMIKRGTRSLLQVRGGGCPLDDPFGTDCAANREEDGAKLPSELLKNTIDPDRVGSLRVLCD